VDTKQRILEVSNLTVHYHSIPVLWDIHLELFQGSLTAILGPNGAGKSTLIKAILQTLKPVSGSILLFDKPFSQVRRRCAYVPQREAVDWDFPITVQELVLMGSYPKLGAFSRVKKSDKERCEHFLEVVGLQELAQRQISQLSGGQQQRAFLARALLQDPDFYFLDEPLAGIDHATEELIMQLLGDAVKKGKTVLMVHHDLNSVEKYFDWLILLNVRLVACGETKVVFTKEMLRACYGKNFALFDETLKLSQNKLSGMYS